MKQHELLSRLAIGGALGASFIVSFCCSPNLTITVASLFLYLFSLKELFDSSNCSCDKKQQPERFFRQIISFCLIILVASTLIFLYLLQQPRSIFFFVALVKSADIGAFAGGKILSLRSKGNHLLVPHLSPKKSWEGLICGFLLTLLVNFVFNFFTFLGWQLNHWQILESSSLAVIFGLAGDLLESRWKRSAKIKNSGKIPGLGGFLDIVDSLLLSMPFLYLWHLFIFW